MKFTLIPFLAFITAWGIFHISVKKTTPVADTETYKKKNVVRCSPDWNVLSEYIESTDIPPMPGAGKYKWDIHSKNDSAQFYFNQGINMYYGFHIIESMASFMKAAKFDSTNAMIWWAQALAYGPNINDAAYNASPLALEAIKKAKDLSGNSSALEKALFNAMSIRYSSDATLSREKLNNDYTMAMGKVYRQFPESADAGALFADAMMLEHPWLLWKNDGTPYAWTPRIREVLEKTLAQNPEHPGANHYYIHVMEPSPYPQKALASADRLGKLTPGLAHLVHMPSHIYLRTGFYKTGYSVNEEAVKQYKDYLNLYPAVVGGEALYRLHNEHMLVNCAMHAGRKKYTIDAALALQNSIDAALLSDPSGFGNYMQYTYRVPTLVMIRFEDWNGLLNATESDTKHVYGNLLMHFGKGMAFVAKNNLPDAYKELSSVESLLKDSSLQLSFAPFSSAIDGAAVAAYLLKGSIALKEKKTNDAITNFKMAVEREKNMVYNEPRDWLLNPKNYLARAYFQTGKYKAAEKVFMQDLNDNNENVWSLAGLYKTLQKQNKTAAANAVKARFKKAASASDFNFME